jgi:hypothetical protein
MNEEALFVHVIISWLKMMKDTLSECQSPVCVINYKLNDWHAPWMLRWKHMEAFSSNFLTIWPEAHAFLIAHCPADQ